MVLTGRATQLCAIVLLASASSGCGSLVAALQSAIKAQPGSVELVTVTTKLPQVLSCIERTDGVCAASVVGAPSHVMRDICNQLRAYTETTQAIGTQAICDPTAAKLEEIMNAAAGRPIDEKQPSLSRSGTRDFAKTLFDAANVRSWTQISAALRPRAEKLPSLVHFLLMRPQSVRLSRARSRSPPSSKPISPTTSTTGTLYPSPWTPAILREALPRSFRESLDFRPARPKKWFRT
jgi:hypothetical protein